MKLLRHFFSYFLFLIFLFSSLGHSANIRESAKKPVRERNPFGIYLGVFDPYPSFAGINVGMNVADFLRFHVGYGPMKLDSGDLSVSVNTYAAGANLFVPDWNFSPTIGISWAQVTVIGGVSNAGDIYGLGGTASHTYLSFGFDWQTGIGFNMGLGYNYSLRKNVVGLPYFNIGWYI